MNKCFTRGFQIAAAAGAISVFGMAANATILNFNLLVGNNFNIGTTNYGDNVTMASNGILNYLMGDGWTPNVTTSYVPSSDFRYFNSGYGDMLQVAFTNATLMEITFTAAEGFQVELRGFDLAGFQGNRPLSLLEVRDGSNALLLMETALTINGTNVPPRRNIFTFDPPLTSDVITIRLSDPELFNIAIDNIHITEIEGVVKNPCPSDSTGDGVVNAADLGSLLNDWGPNPGSPSDITGDGVVNASDLGSLLNDWGPCPE